MSVVYRYCPACGSRYHGEQWPRACGCGATVFRNPLPVAVLLVPVDDGLLAIRRADPPYGGGLALPGGFIEHGEPWRVAAARETFEECGVRVDAETIEPFGIESTGGIVLLFGLARPIDGQALPAFTPNTEVSERLILRQPKGLVFPLHTAACTRYFAEARRR